MVDATAWPFCRAHIETPDPRSQITTLAFAYKGAISASLPTTYSYDSP
jgi:hypothetical protein